MSYTDHIANKQTPQSEQARDDQVKNTAGGYGFEISDWKRLERFLIIGNEGGSYYATERKLTVENCSAIQRLLKIDGKKVVDMILEVSQGGRASKNLPAIFALAITSVFGNQQTRAYANKMVPYVCRYSTDLYTWVNAVNELKNGKKGSGLRRAIGRWYVKKDTRQLAYQMCKYPARSIKEDRKAKGKVWGHRDLLRIARPGLNKQTSSGKPDPALTTPSNEHNLVFRYAVRGIGNENAISPELLTQWQDNENLKYIYAHEKAKVSESSAEIVQLIEDFNITRESVPNHLFNNSVWSALLQKMPMTALIRNLGRMTASGVLKPLSDDTIFVANTLTSEEALQGARIHPMNVFLAMTIYNRGQGERSSWTPVPAISDALEKAFYASFKYVEPTNKKILLAVDVSGSMSCSCQGNSVITAAQAAGVMAMAIAHTEPNHHIVAFSSKGSWGSNDNQLVKLPITSSDSLKSVYNKINAINMGWTDCALPMLYASEEKLDVDAFVILTDNESWAGDVHPFEAMAQYRKNFNSRSKLVSLAFSASNYSVADPNDAGMMDISGLDSAVPKILNNFIADKI